jgi:hypothetical protein
MSRNEGGGKCLIYIYTRYETVFEIMIFIFTSCLLPLVPCPSYGPRLVPKVQAVFDKQDNVWQSW